MFNGLTITFPNSQIQPKKVYKMSYRQANYEHDYARVYFRDWEIDISRVRPGSPMTITLDGKELVGYVHDVKTFKDNNKDFTEVGFIGASYVMRQSSQAMFKDVTASAVAEKIARKYGFSYKIEPHPRVYKQVSQAGLTDWQFLVKLAKQCGYFVKAESTTLYFQPVFKEAEETITEAPVFSKIDAGFKSVNPLYSFTPIIGETLGHTGADKAATAVAGVDPETGQYFKYTKPKRNTTTRQIAQPELFDKFATAVVAPSYDVAKYEAESIDERSKFPYVAEAEILGTSRVRPGGPIYLQNIGNKYSGYWTVIEVTHEVVEDSVNLYKFTSVITVASDSLGETATAKYPSKPSARGVRNISPALKGTKAKPKNLIKTPTIKVTPPKEIKLVDRINRAANSGARVAQATWTSSTGNLKAAPVTATRNATSVKKAVNYFGRR